MRCKQKPKSGWTVVINESVIHTNEETMTKK